MGTRQKLNVAHVRGALIVAAASGALTGSWTIFAATLAILIVGSLYDGAVRPRGRGR